jgi:hypothetical protein
MVPFVATQFLNETTLNISSIYGNESIALDVTLESMAGGNVSIANTTIVEGSNDTFLVNQTNGNTTVSSTSVDMTPNQNTTVDETTVDSNITSTGYGTIDGNSSVAEGLNQTEYGSNFDSEPMGNSSINSLPLNQTSSNENNTLSMGTFNETTTTLGPIVVTPKGSNEPLPLTTPSPITSPPTSPTTTPSPATTTMGTTSSSTKLDESIQMSSTPLSTGSTSNNETSSDPMV